MQQESCQLPLFSVFLQAYLQESTKISKAPSTGYLTTVWGGANGDESWFLSHACLHGEDKKLWQDEFLEEVFCEKVELQK